MGRLFWTRFTLALTLISVSYGCGEDGATSGGAGGMAPADDMMMAAADSDAEAMVEDQGVLIRRCVNDESCDDDQYCRVNQNDGERLCAFGCREGGCDDGQVCDLDGRICIRDTSCESDDDCFGGEYCGEGQCQEGCRVGNADDCPRNENGEPRACDPATHTCVIQVVCCDAFDQCSLELPDECSDPILGERGCFNPNPCSLRCEEDGDCEAGNYCGEDGRCTEGCRLVGQSGCSNDRVCDDTTRECIRPPCDADDDCDDDFFCDDTVCLAGCRQDPDNCRRGEYCDERRRCVPDDVPMDCVDDAQCAASNGAGWYCDGIDCQPPCGAHEDCPPNEACLQGRCGEGCRDDDFEENDDRARARALVFEDNQFDSGEGVMYLCARDPDWYTFEAPSDGMTMDIALSFAHDAGNLDMRLYGPDGEEVARAASRDNDETIRYASNADNPSPRGRYWIEVYGRGFAENTYTLGVQLTQGLGPDGAEVDNTAETGTVLSLPNIQETRIIEDRTLHPNDEDWFGIDMGARDGLTIRLDMLGNDTGRDDEFTFELFGPGIPDGMGPLEGGEAANGVRYVQFTAPRFNFLIQDGRYNVRVYGLNGQQVGRYRLTITVDRENILCTPDVAEPNDDGATAFDLMGAAGFSFVGFDGTAELNQGVDLRLDGLTLCEDEDWYSVSLRDGDDLEVRLERLEANLRGDTHVEIYDRNGRSLAEGRSGDRRNVARVEDVDEGIYQIRARSMGMARTAYELVLFRTAGPIACDADRYDAANNNDARANASLIEIGTHRDLSLCGAEGDEDWFRFTVDSEADLTTTIRFAHAQGDLDLELFFEDEVGALNRALRAGHSNDDDETISLGNRAPGNYVLRVRSIGPDNVRYSLEIGVEERVFVCVDDPDEPNGTFDDSTELGNNPVDRANQWICERNPVDEDTFHIVVPQGASRTIATRFLFGDDGDQFLQLFDADNMALVSTADIQRGNSKQCIVIPADNNFARGFFVKVVPLSINRIQQDDERLDYELIVRAGEDCDAIEPETPGVDWPILGE